MFSTTNLSFKLRIFQVPYYVKDVTEVDIFGLNDASVRWLIRYWTQTVINLLFVDLKTNYVPSSSKTSGLSKLLKSI